MHEWSDLRVFLAVARGGTLGAAARLTGQTQPTMGRRLRALEAALGRSLFQRTSDGFVLTDEGAAVLEHAESVERATFAIERRLAGSEAGLDGTLRITASDWFGLHVLSPLAARFGARHPGVCLELLTDARAYDLARREADLAFRIAPFRGPDLVTRRVLSVPYAAYLAAGLDAPTPGDGSGHRLITMNEGFADMPDARWLRRVLPRAAVGARSNSRDVQARLCREGAGLAVLPRPLGDAVPGIRALDLGEPPPGRATHLGYHRDLRALPRLRAFLALLDEDLAGAAAIRVRASGRPG